MSSYYPDFFEKPKDGKQKNFLWKVGIHGDVVVERLDDSTENIVSSGRGFAALGRIGNYDFYRMLDTMLSNSLDEDGDSYRVVLVPRIWEYGVGTLAELCEKLNAKGSNKAKRLWNGLPGKLQRPELIRNTDGAWVVDPKSLT